uniref:Uncharacterized protein n=1 Tax=Spongospora subterranea TaxID=70186 RepID=A0A0H5QHD6_9EUKA|eukprot:CRZ01072.1 hypothetical protein [Spongospora subterranea]
MTMTPSLIYRPSSHVLSRSNLGRRLAEPDPPSSSLSDFVSEPTASSTPSEENPPNKQNQQQDERSLTPWARSNLFRVQIHLIIDLNTDILGGLNRGQSVDNGPGFLDLQ